MADDEKEALDLTEYSEKGLLLRIAQELKQIRQFQSELLKFYRNAEQEVPEYMRRFANYMHDLHDIAYMYSEIGQEPPQWLKQEQMRCDDRMRQLLKAEHTDGAFAKVRREMAGDEENRWDHTKQLEFKGRSQHR